MRLVCLGWRGRARRRSGLFLSRMDGMGMGEVM
jgi:hypothetical protein